MTRKTTLYPLGTVIYRKRPRPAETFDGDVIQVQARCAARGGDPAAIALLPVIFPDGISQNALTRQMTSNESGEYHSGHSGQVYRIILRIDEEKRFRCRLCAVGSDERGWKHARDALRHLKRDHFGLGDRCNAWYVNVHYDLYRAGLTSSPFFSGKLVYTRGEMSAHRCRAQRVVIA
jgi:hypothetical protein